MVEMFPSEQIVIPSIERTDLFARLSRAALPCYYQPRAVMWHLLPVRKLTRSYVENLSRQIGVSQRLRAEQAGTCGRLRLAESLKWGATLLLATGYLCTLQPSKALYLLRMRWQISRGVFGKIE